MGLRHLRHFVAVTDEQRLRHPAERLLVAGVMRVMGLLGLGGTVRLVTVASNAHAAPM